MEENQSENQEEPVQEELIQEVQEYYEENDQNELYNEIPQEAVENIDLSEAIEQEYYSEDFVTNENSLESSMQNFIEHEEEYYDENSYEEDDFEIENYIEVNEDIVMKFNDWMYDAIINKTLKELQIEYEHDLIDILTEAKRDSNGFLSLLHLESKEYRLICRYMERAYRNSYKQEKRVYIRKAHNQFLREFKNLIDVMVRDERYTMF